MRVFGLLLLLFGMLIAGYGIYGAVSDLGQTYQHVLEDPLGESEVDENTELPRRMLIHVAIGATGVVPLVPGVVLLRIARIQRRRQQLEKAAARQSVSRRSDIISGSSS